MAKPQKQQQAEKRKPAPPRNGAELVKRLADSGTPAGKLEPARAALRSVWEGEGRLAGCDEVVAALEAAGVPELTLAKARAFAETGEYTPAPSGAARPIEDELLDAAGDDADADDGAGADDKTA